MPGMIKGLIEKGRSAFESPRPKEENALIGADRSEAAQLERLGEEASLEGGPRRKVMGVDWRVLVGKSREVGKGSDFLVFFLVFNFFWVIFQG